MNSFTDQALALLADGQRTTAAALFDAARKLKPADMAAQNNYAFCILPDKPEQALELFTDALSRDVPHPIVTWCNLALAESLIGHPDAALKACEQAYAITTGDPKTAHLWKRQDDDWAVELTNPRAWVIRFGAELEQSAGTLDVWAERVGRLSLGEMQGPSEDPSSAETGGADL
jgi:Tfp pilus assembly protein PilF